MVKWAHEKTVLVHHGKVKLVCSCGGQSPYLSLEESVMWWIKHTKVKEKTTKEES